ncbi:MAG: 5-formyltetrahydrofolate cyclo-ligase [Clostridia bacterium]|nr:5-formyltetrahydrofolate cyclo-ligase [Clostridia bacterium]
MSEVVKAIDNPKSERRAAARTLRDALPADLRQAASDAICKKIAAMASFGLCETLLCYYPIGSEVDLRPLMTHALACGKRVGLPLYDEAQATMEFYAISSTDDVAPVGKLGIPSPHAEEANRIIPDGKTMLLLPGLLFDGRGHRIGSGCGVYDRYIFAHKELLHSSLCIGVSYAALVSDIPIPYTAEDVSVSLIVTEKKLIFARKVERAPKWEVRRRRYVPLVDKDGNPQKVEDKPYYNANYVSPQDGKYLPPSVKELKS